MPVLIVLVVLLAALLVSNIKVVPQAYTYVIERLGTYHATWDAGVHITVPIIDHVAKKVSLKEVVYDFDPQSVITKDNVTMQIDTVVFMQIIDPKLYTYGVNEPISAIENLTATSLRNIIGDIELDETLTSRDIINSKITEILDRATDKWGIKVNRVELKNIIPPKDIREAMEKQMRAERERRETLLEAEGHKQAVVTREEGNKQAKILAAEAEKAAAIAKAEGEARAIELVYKAQAEGLKRIRDVAGPDGMMLLKKLETLGQLGDGRATKLIVPTDLTGTASNLSLAGEFLGISNDKVDTSPKEAEHVDDVDVCCDEDAPKIAPSPSQSSKATTSSTTTAQDKNQSINNFVIHLNKETGKSYKDCMKALQDCQYDVNAALKLLQGG